MEDREPYHLERIWNIKLLYFPFNLSEPQFQNSKNEFDSFFFLISSFLFLDVKQFFFFPDANLIDSFKGEKISAWCIHKLDKIRLCVSTRRRYKICLGWRGGCWEATLCRIIKGRMANILPI